MTRIPKIIHQTWETNEVPEKWKEAETEWRTFCDVYGYEYRFWNANDRRELVATQFPWYLETFDALPMNVQRADTWRYFALYVYGGVYIDLDFVPKHTNMAALLQYYNNIDTSVAVAKSATAQSLGSFGEILTNAFMMSEKEAPFWKLVWEEMKQPLSKGDWTRKMLKNVPYFQVIFGTGPGATNKALKKYLSTEESKLHPFVKIPCEFISCGFEWDPKPFETQESAVKLLEGSSWHTKSMKIYRHLSRAIYNKDTINGIMIAVLVIVVVVLLLLLFARKQFA